MIELFDDPEPFAQRAGPLIESRIENTILATVLRGVRDGRYPETTPRFAVVSDAAGDIVGAALRTPPWPLVTTALAPEDAAALIERWLAVDPDLPGLNAEVATARALAAAVTRRTGVTPRLSIRQALHVLEPGTLRAPPRPAAGRLRAPTDEEQTTCVAWELQFAEEAGVEAPADQAERMARDRIAAGRAYVWDDGEPVCLLGHTPVVAGVPRVGPVYTPPARRGRGYASSAVHALSRQLLGAGADRVVLFTDLANSTSNRIYADVGYRRVGEWELHRVAG